MNTNTKELPKSYESQRVESIWYSRWIDAGIFTPTAQDVLKNDRPKTPYVIIMPPPNVTGVLHNGHALFVTLQDILVRYHRMMGYETLWLPGTDHAGIATQTVVERELKRTENKTRQDLGRKEFVNRILEFVGQNGNRIVEQMKMMGASADWSRCRFTLDDGCSQAVREAFVQLWNDGLIYRGERLVSWDPSTQTALSDEEVEHVTREGELWAFAYAVKGSDREIVVATTRPETMLGDTAVAVHPKDARFLDLIGSELVHPFFPERKVTVIADDHVDPEFGSGAVKITPAHDPNDFAMSTRHGLERISIFTLNGSVNENGGRYQGLDRFEARKQIKNDLTELGFFRETKKIQHAVSVSQRSGADIEPMLSRQYFVHTKTLARNADAVVQSGETQILPAGWKKTWEHFMQNIQDWCISRQLWWGHQIPVFYDVELLKAEIEKDATGRAMQAECHKALLGNRPISEVLRLALSELSDDAVRSFSKASVDDLSLVDPKRFIQEEDVLDTWFSAGLWPFSTLGWPNKTDDLKAFYPSAVLETGFDILFFWVARMMMFGVHFMGKSPFKDIYLHAMVRDAQGRKMSKSLGNAVDPVDVIQGISLEDLLAKTKTYPVPEKMLPQVLEGIKKDYPDGIPAAGADGLRLSLAMLSGSGRDVKLALGRVAGYRAFLNKIWNATRFVFMRIGEEPVGALSDVRGHLELEDRWILSRLQDVVAKTNDQFSTYRFSDAAEGIYHFFWNEFCDWYLELVKSRLDENTTPHSREAARTVLMEVLDESMRLLHPICPFISEEIWQLLPDKSNRSSRGFEFCAVTPFPKANEDLVDATAEREIGFLQEVVVALRNAKQESNLPAQKRTPAYIFATSSEHIALLKKYRSVISRLAITEEPTIDVQGAIQVPALSAVNAGAHFEVAIPLEGLLDVKLEKDRLAKELVKIEKEIASLSGRLQNTGFVSKAPPEVIVEHQKQLKELENRAVRISTSLMRFEKIDS
jgi:valyl-tRNA synthetase